MRNLAWHFVKLVDGVPTLRDGRPVPPVGEWLEHDGPTTICSAGLHASWRALDALDYWYAEGGAVCLVDVDGIGEEHGKAMSQRNRDDLANALESDFYQLVAGDPRGMADALKAIARYKGWAAKGGDNHVDYARQFACEELRDAIASRAKGAP